jgi:hypothetical protein
MAVGKAIRDSAVATPVVLAVLIARNCNKIWDKIRSGAHFLGRRKIARQTANVSAQGGPSKFGLLMDLFLCHCGFRSGSEVRSEPTSSADWES